MKAEFKIIIIIAIVAAVVSAYVLINHSPANKPSKLAIKPDTTKDSVWYDHDDNGHIRP